MTDFLLKIIQLQLAYLILLYFILSMNEKCEDHPEFVHVPIMSPAKNNCIISIKHNTTRDITIS